MGSQASHSRVRFAGFELDLRTGELRKNGRRVRLQAQPLKALRVLLEHPGELVTREQLRKEVWPEDTFVDFDHGLNKAVAKLRDAVDESGTSPSIIETLPRLGYRFIPTVEWSDDDLSSNKVAGTSSEGHDEEANGEASQPVVAERSRVHKRSSGSGRRIALLIAAALVLVLVAIPIVKRIRDDPFCKAAAAHQIHRCTASGEPVWRSRPGVLRGRHDRRADHNAGEEPRVAGYLPDLCDAVQEGPPTAAGDRAGARSGWDSGRFGGPLRKPSAHDSTTDRCCQRHACLGGKLRSRFE